MQKIPIHLAAPGMKLARPVQNEQGLVLVGAGTELTPGILARLQQMGISKLVVEGHPVDLPNEGPRTPEELRAAYEERFSIVGDDPVLMNLKELLLARDTKALD